MAIGVAMLGFGVSGTVVALWRRIPPAVASQRLGWCALLTALALVIVPIVTTRIPLDTTQLLWDVRQWPAVGALYLLLAAPFAAGGLVVLLALTSDRDHSGWLYGASFIGSGIGVVLALSLLWLVTPARAVAVPAVLAALGACAVMTRAQRSAAWATLALSIGVAVIPLWTQRIAPYKTLPQTEGYPRAQRVAERTSPLGWVVAVDAPAFRYAPGLSLGFRGQVPHQTALFVDGGLVGAAAAWSRVPDSSSLLGWVPSALPYSLDGMDSVLVLGAGGGLEVATAQFNGATHVTAIELLPDIVDLARQTSEGDTPDTQVSWIITDARSFTARTAGHYDLVTIGPAGSLGSSAAGIHALNEDFLHTTEAYTRFLQLLGERGVLAITRWLSIPPRANVRVILTSVEALQQVAPDHVADGLIVARSWGTATTLVKPSGFTAHDVARLRAWAKSRQFDIDWEPGLTVLQPGFHELAEPTLFRAAAAATDGDRSARAFAGDYPLRVEPVTDARPYPHHFLGSQALKTLLKSRSGDWLPFAEWGYVTLIATLLQSVVLAALLLLAPAWWLVRSAPRVRVVPALGYFGAIGLAYLATEIAILQLLTLLLGHPVYAVTSLLAVMLVCSGVGSVWSDRVASFKAWIPPAVLSALIAVVGLGLLPAVHASQGAALPVRLVVAVVVLVPIAVVMGMPFPLGLKTLVSDDSRQVAWGWAANGFASVVAAPLAALLALEAGSSVVLFAAALCYAAAAVISISSLATRERQIAHAPA